MTSYYLGREESLADLFGAASVSVGDDHLDVDGIHYPVVDDVIITLAHERLPATVRARVAPIGSATPSAVPFAEDIQFSFGAEWTEHGDVLADHQEEFRAYFDLIDLDDLTTKRVADLGCGSGRWATFVAPRCRELVVADFSEAIFVARRNLAGHDNVIFVMADVLELPFADDAFDLSYSLGVLHHLPADALDACRALAPLGPELLVYLYYALDNRPPYYRAILGGVTRVRSMLARVRSRRLRSALSLAIAALVYAPLAFLGSIVGARARRFVPLADTYAGKSFPRLRQDAYDRFFTRIEQRVSRAEIASLRDTFAEVRLSDGLPYWHFLCLR